MTSTHPLSTPGASTAAPDSFGGLSLPPGFEALAEQPRLAEVVLQAMEEVEQELAEAVAHASDELADTASRHLLAAGGKRIRPLLTILASLAGQAPRTGADVPEVNAQTRRAAVVMELTHLATLYHDDVMDEAPVRRGAPSAHRLWGNSVAILAGDLLFARASQLMSTLGETGVRIQAETFERLVMGQLWETVGPGEGQDPLEHYLQVLGGKTGSLIAAAGRLGAHFGNGDDTTVQVLADYGEKVGMAFQLADDVIDLTSTSSGKVPGTDLKERVPTLPVLLLRRAAQDPDDETARRAVELIDGPLDTEEQLSAAVRAVSEHAVIEQSWEITRQWADQARQALEPLPASPVKDALGAFARYVVSRDS